MVPQEEVGSERGRGSERERERERKLWVRSRVVPVVLAGNRARRCGRPTSRLPRRRSSSGTTSNR